MATFIVQDGAPDRMCGLRVKPGDMVHLTEREAAFHLRNGSIVRKPKPKRTPPKRKARKAEE